MKINKYFWGLNEKALHQTKRVIGNPGNPKFLQRIVTLLSRCDKPKELFSMISKEQFIEAWPKIRRYWARKEQSSDFKAWWESIYQELIRRQGKRTKPPTQPAGSLIKIGKTIKEARARKGLRQSALAIRAGMNQPDISAIEKGKSNLTIETLLRLSNILDIRNITLNNK